MGGRTTDEPTGADAQLDAVSRERELALRVLQLEEDKARLERERFEYALMGESLTGELSNDDVAHFHQYLRDRQRHPELLRDGRIVPVDEVPPLAILDLADLFHWRHALAETTRLQTFLYLVNQGEPQSTANTPEQLSVLAECAPACRQAVDQAVQELPADTERPVGVRCKGCGRPLWIVPISLRHQEHWTPIAYVAGHALPSPTRSYRKMVELAANEVGRRASAEYANQVNTILQMRMSAMIDKFMQQKVETAGKAEGALAAMSHEIRTPLTCVIGFADLLAMPSLTVEEAHKFAGSIKESGQVLLSLINNILDLSKIEAGCLELERIPYSLRQVLAEVVNIFLPSSREMKVDIHVRVAGNVPPEQMGDPMRLRQVLLNLVGNALKFTRQGRIDLVCNLDDADPDLLEIAVQDTGTGIPRNRLDTIFEAYQQADSQTARKYGGTGLGLSISRRIIEVMGGQMSVTSCEGEGSCFTFTLPGQLVGEPVGPYF
jgi:signal transduction histidine kinase